MEDLPCHILVVLLDVGNVVCGLSNCIMWLDNFGEPMVVFLWPYFFWLLGAGKMNYSSNYCIVWFVYFVDILVVLPIYALLGFIMLGAIIFLLVLTLIQNYQVGSFFSIYYSFNYIIWLGYMPIFSHARWRFTFTGIIGLMRLDAIGSLLVGLSLQRWRKIGIRLVLGFVMSLLRQIMGLLLSFLVIYFIASFLLLLFIIPS